MLVMSKEIAKIISDIISQNGPISVEAYWNLCLAHPTYGYYITRDPLGAAGDFTTAPEISQLFGEMVGIWCVEKWHELGRPDAVYLVECGPGRGTLMADILRIGKVMPEFLSAVQVHLIETSPSLRAKQGETLKGHQIVWHESLTTLPDNAPMIVIGNEFLDALPIRQYVMQNEKWFERVIGLNDDGRPAFGLLDSPHPNLPPQVGKALENMVVEISPARENFMADVYARISAQDGAALMIDYGHDVTSAGDTFQAVRNHQYHDVLSSCGDADLTSHVDFGRLTEIAKAQDLSVQLSGQGDFLTRMGIQMRAAQLAEKSDKVTGELHRLVDVQEMGQLFRVMEVTK